MARNDALAMSIAPRGLCREDAARYLAIGTTLFDQHVKAGTLPKPKMIGGRKVWDVRKLDRAFDDLPEEGEVHPWDA